MKVRDGLIPLAVGSLVTAGTLILRIQDMKKRPMDKSDIVPMAETAALGFGAAHVVLGAIDLIQS